MAKTTPSNPIDALIYEVNSKLNAGVKRADHIKYIRRATDTVAPFKLRRPTGILSIDRSIAGGWPAGGLCQVAAPSGVGKNALCLQTLAECQRIYGSNCNIAWIPTEFPVDKLFAQNMGVKIPMSLAEIELENKARKRDGRDKLTKKQVTRMQEGLGQFLIVDIGSTAKRFEATVGIVKSNMFQIVVVDSLGAVLTEQREDTELGEFAQQSSEAFLITEFQKKLWGAYSPNPKTGEPNWTTMLVINQIRDKRDARSFGRKWTVGGANAVKHAKLIDIWMTGGEAIQGKRARPAGEYESEDEDEDEEDTKGKKIKIGKKIRYEIMKAKAGSAEGPKGQVEFHYDSGFQIEKDTVDAALDAGVLLRTGKAKYALIDEDGEILDEVVGKKVLYERAYDQVWFRAVYDLTLKKDGISCAYKL